MLTDEEIRKLCISLMNKYEIFDDQANLEMVETFMKMNCLSILNMNYKRSNK